MGQAVDDLFEQATGADSVTLAEPVTARLLALPGVAPVLQPLLNQRIPALLQALVEHTRRCALAPRLDGLIIGTGEADFTKGNTTYTLQHKGKIFQLIDVPGIEGDETRYVDEVRKAVAKAHLVVYVNGTNKKPEKATAQKIRAYLRHGTQVCPLVNVRGHADAYEFEEDRESLELQGGAQAALQQTMEVLEPVLGAQVLLPGHCVQGLLGFSALAFHAPGQTSIHPCRDRDLVVQQRNYLKHFPNPRAMYEFSQVKALAQVLHGKLGTFQSDIVESNKVKVRELLTDYLNVLHEQLQGHQVFLARVEPEFDKCRAAFKAALKSFERLLLAGRENHWKAFFNTLLEEADEIVEQKLGDAEQITSGINRAFKSGQRDTGKVLQEHLQSNLEVLQEQLERAMKRLLEDVQRVEFQQRLVFEQSRRWHLPDGMDFSDGLNLGDLGSIAWKIGSYAALGGSIGTPFAPGIGTAIGAAVGAAVGALLALLDRFLGRDRRVRKAQAQVREKIEAVHDDVLDGLPDEVRRLAASVEKEIAQGLLSQVNALQQSLLQPLRIFEQQIQQMNRLKDQLEKMPYGTIQAVQY